MIGRPNALDRAVSAIPAHDLLTRSPLDLIDPARAAAAGHLEQMRIPVWIVMVALQIAVLAWFWNSGLSARLRDWLRARVPLEFGVRFCFGALLALLDRAVALAPQGFDYRFTRIMDLTEMLLRTWILDWIAGTLIAMAAAGSIAAIVLWLADRTHQWYVYTIAAIIGFTLLVSYANPYVFAPAHTRLTLLRLHGTLARSVAALERESGVDVPLLESYAVPRTRSEEPYISGWGGSQRVVIPDTLAVSATEPELEFILARSFAWIRANNGLHLALVQGAFVVLGTALAVFISDRIGFRRDDDPVSRLALFGAVMGCVFLIALPFYNGYSRNAALTTDLAGAALDGRTAPAIRLEVRRADQALVAVCPNPFAFWYLSDAPAPGQRIAALQGRSDPCLTPRR